MTTDVIKSQFFAALSMLEGAVAACPHALWTETGRGNPFWRVAYHTLFYVHLYLQPTQDDFTPWEKHRTEHEMLGPPPWAPDRPPAPGTPYTPAEILEYAAVCRQQVDRVIPTLDLTAPSGFHWLPFNKLELQFYNIRHLQQHVGELSTILLLDSGIEVDWVGKGP